MKRLLSYITILSALLLTLVTACDHAVLEQSPAAPPSYGREALVSVNFSSTTEQVGFEESIAIEPTRTTRAPGGINEELISDVWMFQFNGTTDNATLVSVPNYNPLDAQQKAHIPFIDTEGDTHRIVFIANTHSSQNIWNLRPGISTYSELISRVSHIMAETDVYSPLGIIMSGSIDAIIDEQSSGSFSASLTRAVAKVQLTLSLDALAVGFSIRSVQLCHVPTSFSHTEPLHPSRPVPFPTSGQQIDYLAVTGADITMPTPGGPSTTFQWYIPTNMQGTTDNTLVAQKNILAPSKATFMRIVALSPEGTQVIYTLYPGADLVSDFNLRVNHRYLLALNIKGKGDPYTDSRIEDFGNVDYTTRSLSNSYILNPPPSGIAYRKYKIPVGRVDQYWGDPQYVGRGNDSKHTLEHDVPWSVALYWQDHADMVRQSAAGYITFTKSTGVGKNDYFELSVPPSVPQGNFVVALSKGGSFDSNAILWSWHFWVTDYNPYSFLTPSPDQYVYAVSGGRLHRYKGAIWDGENASKMIMDRNIGATNGTAFSYPEGALYYQFGRKDPLPGNTPLYDVDGVPLGTTTTPAWNGANANVIVGRHSMDFAIHNPLRHVGTVDSWISGVMFTRTGLHNGQSTYDDGTMGMEFHTWHDPKLPGSVTGPGTKSIFDPSPWGFKVPRHGIWADFRTNTATSPTTNVNGNSARVFPMNLATAEGMLYWPYIKVGNAYPVEGTIYYPATGFRLNSTGVIQSMRVRGYSWRSSAADDVTGIYNTFTATLINEFIRATRASGLPVRCIQE